MSTPHWTFYAEILSRSIADLESACTAAPDSSEFVFLRSEAPAIVAEAREALKALSDCIQNYDNSDSIAQSAPTAH